MALYQCIWFAHCTSQKERNPEVVKQTAFIQAEHLQLLMYINENQTHKFYSFM